MLLDPDITCFDRDADSNCESNFNPEDFTESINQVIKLASESGVDINSISDGYHTFGELYEHRCRLFIALCKVYILKEGYDACRVWRARKHSDGTSYDGWFILGLGEEPGEQITYHLPNSLWEETEGIDEYELAPQYDGHTSVDVLQRLQTVHEAVDYGNWFRF